MQPSQYQYYIQSIERRLTSNSTQQGKASASILTNLQNNAIAILNQYNKANYSPNRYIINSPHDTNSII